MFAAMEHDPKRRRSSGLVVLLCATAATGYALWHLLDAGSDAPSTSRTVRLAASGLMSFAALGMAWFAGRQGQAAREP